MVGQKKVVLSGGKRKKLQPLYFKNTYIEQWGEQEVDGDDGCRR